MVKSVLFFFGEKVTDESLELESDKWRNLPKLFFGLDTAHPIALCIDLTRSTVTKVAKLHKDFLKIAVLVEPVSVNSYQYTKIALQHFHYVFYCQSRPPHVLPGLIPLFNGQISFGHRANLELTIRNCSERINGVAIVASQKFSGHGNSAYYLRKKAVDLLTQGGFYLQVAGKDWNLSRVRRFLKWVYAIFTSLTNCGEFVFRIDDLKLPNFTATAIDDKFSFYAKYEIALVIENEPTAVSEKLFDALSSGCRVIYVGPRLHETLYPKEYVFQVAPQDIGSVLTAAEYFVKNPISNVQLFRAWLTSIINNPSLSSESRIQTLVSFIQNAGSDVP
jgi:hypothetical protein